MSVPTTMNQNPIWAACTSRRCCLRASISSGVGDAFPPSSISEDWKNSSTPSRKSSLTVRIAPPSARIDPDRLNQCHLPEMILNASDAKTQIRQTAETQQTFVSNDHRSANRRGLGVGSSAMFCGQFVSALVSRREIPFVILIKKSDPA